MALKDLFSRKKQGSLDTEKSGLSNASKKVLKRVEKEALNKQEQYYLEIKFKELNSYGELLKSDAKELVQIVFSVVGEVMHYQKRWDNRISNINDEALKLKNVYESLLKALIRRKMEFRDIEIISLFNLYREKSREAKHYRFHNWPIGFSVKQIEYLAKRDGISEALKKFLGEMLEWDEFKDDEKQYWGSDLGKAKRQIQKLLFGAENKNQGTPPFSLNQGDDFGKEANKTVLGFKPEVQECWHGIFHLAIKATGSKPSQKYLKETKCLIDKIGTPKYKKQLQDWVEFTTNLKTVETQQTSTYDGRTYNYLVHIYLNEKNMVLVKGLVWTMVNFHDSKSLALLAQFAERCFQKIPGVGPAAAGIGNACIYVLANSRGLEGISHLSRLKLRIRQNNTRKLIQNQIDKASEKRNISPEEIEEISIPDFGLELGEKQILFEDYKLEVQVNESGKVVLKWFKPDGNEQKTTPAFVKNTAKYSKLLKKARDQAKQIQKYLSAQKDRMDRLLIQEREWGMEDFLKMYLNHGLVSIVARKLVWAFTENGKTTQCLYLNDRWENLDGKEMKFGAGTTKVKLWHPIHSNPETVLLWRQKLEKLQMRQPLKQAYREVYMLTDAEVQTRVYSNRMAAHLLKQHQFSALASTRGWQYSLLGAYDDGRDGEIAKMPLKKYGLTAEYWINELHTDDDLFNDAGIWDYVATDQVRFVDGAGEAVQLADIPQTVFSEIMRDVDLFVGVASVGNDPEWLDNGGLPQYRDYWVSYSFGDLTEVAKTRKEILERLVPRLKIRDVASIEGKFLKIKGKIKTYKIHIGSTNILMEPNDQYLCIVPARGKEVDTSKVFLPFEGDRGLSLVLSKAFLLAEDDKITDKTILSQIGG